MKVFPIKATIYIVTVLAILNITSCCKPNHVKEKEDKTLLIYMDAYNNLASDAVTNIRDLQSGYLPEYDEDDNGEILLVYLKIDATRVTAQTPIETEIFAQPTLFRMYRDSYDEAQIEIVHKFESDQNASTASVLHDVLDKANRLFPAKENGLILWSHATGWLPEGFYSNPRSKSADGAMAMNTEEEPWIDPYAHMVKSFGYNQSSKDEIELTDLAEALPIKYDYIIFDCCLMGNIEVAYELKDVCDYLLFSPTEILAAGFPYDKIISPLLKNKNSDISSVAKEYYDFYNGQSGAYQSATVSVIKTKELDELAEATKALIEISREYISDLTISDIQTYCRKPGYEQWFCDFDHFMESLANTASNKGADKNTCAILLKNFQSALEDIIVYKAATEKFITIPIEHYSGISSYIPKPANSYLDSFYKTLSWNKAVEMIK